jgi:hypothetical protein
MTEALVKHEYGTFEEEALMLRQLKDRKELAAADLKAAEEAYKSQEQIVLEMMKEQGVDSTRLKGIATLTRVEQQIPVAEDWGQIYQFIEDNAMPHLLQRRLSNTAVEELEAIGTPVPGVGKFTRVSLSVRKA